MAQSDDVYLTKTDFVHYLQCPKSLWLLKRKPEVYPHREFSEFLKKITREGYEVEEYAERLFAGGVKLPATGAGLKKTREAVEQGVPVLFQASFLTDDGQFARTDVLERGNDGSYALYEVKSSTGIKRDSRHNHIKDACFQIVALEKAGLSVGKVYIIHVNKEYVRGEEVEPHALLERVDVTDEVRAVEGEVRTDVQNALGLLQIGEIDETGCGCYRKTRSNHCDAFAYFNGEIPDGSVWEIGRISAKKLNLLLERGITNITDVPADDADLKLNDAQVRQVRAATLGEPIIHNERIAEMLGTLVFPLYFFDYETAMNAVPRVPGMRPWQQIPFQFSLHILGSDGEMSHEEFVSDSLFGVEKVMDALIGIVGATGSVVSWHASFEKLRNKEMAALYPKYRKALESMNARMFDLEDVFKEAYADVRFRGSTSIKKVLPVLCPKLSYKALAVQDGTQAMERWFAMVDETDQGVRERIHHDLCRYCELDTFAMVEVYRVLRDIADIA